MKNEIILNLHFDDYLKLDAVSQSGLKDLEKCPRYYQYKKDNPSATSAMEFGSALHSLVLEEKSFSKEYFIAKDIKTKRGNKWDAALMEARERKVLLDKEYLVLCDMKETIMHNPYFSEHMKKSKKEVSMFWQDPDTGIYCKGRADMISVNDSGGAFIFDLKSADDCSRNAFKRQVLNMKYHRQAAFYMDAYKTITGITPTFIFCAIEKKAPYLNTNYSVYFDSETAEIGRKEYKELLNKYSDCMNNGGLNGGGFDVGLENEIENLDTLPAWYKSQILTGE